MTAVNSTSGTSIDFTGIPSGKKRITIMLSGVSTNASSNLQIQIGSGSVETTGCTARASSFNNTPGGVFYTSGFVLNSVGSSVYTWTGIIVLTNITGNTWITSGSIGGKDTSQVMSLFTGSKTASGVIDRVRITTTAGTDTFDAGTINILYE